MNRRISLLFKQPSHGYTVFITDDRSFVHMTDKIRSVDCSRIVIITNSLVWRLYGSRIGARFQKKGLKYTLIVLPDGEKFKNLKTAGTIYDKLLKCGADRYTLLIGIGGGVIGDITGFVASTYMRGVRYIQVPTTLLSQVDASIGGKTGVDHPRAKNIIGAFYQPDFVYTNVNFLKTLSPTLYRAGLAEVIKYGAIKDERLFSFMEGHARDIADRHPNIIMKLVCDSARIKSDIVQQDEKEISGKRMLLNFGHTVGHAIESLSGYTVLHGEAVGIGMIVAARISCVLALCQRDVSERMESLVRDMGLPVSLKGLNKERLSKAVEYDKKNKGNKIKLVLLKRLGVPVLYETDKTGFMRILMEVKL